MTNVKHGLGDASVDLVGDAGAVLTLQAATTQLGTMSYEWAPRDKRALDLEVRVRTERPNGSSNLTSFRVAYTIEAGAGVSVFTEPRVKAFNAPAGTLPAELLMPDRGVQFRINARRLKLTFRLVRLIAPLDSVELNVAVQPARGSEVPRAPGNTIAQSSATLWNSIPLASREWRIRRSDGTAFAAAANTIALFNLCGRPFGSFDAVSASDWVPIPPAASFFTSVPLEAIVEYR